MRFAHLTGRTRVATIRANGLRLGAGRRGRGLYCVPLVNLRFPDIVNGWTSPGSILSDPRSSSHLWRWMRGDEPARRQTAVVIFAPPARVWPADLYLWTPRGVSGAVLARVKSLGLEFERCPPCEPLGIRLARDLRVRVPDARKLGLVLEPFLARLGRFNGWQVQTALELVFRLPIPASAVRRVVPLFRTSAEHKARRRAFPRALADGWE